MYTYIIYAPRSPAPAVALTHDSDFEKKKIFRFSRIFFH